jgi:hypothetical protein
MTDTDISRVSAKINPEAAAFMAAWDAAKASSMSTIADLTAQRNRALEAVEKLRDPVRWFADEMEKKLKENDWKKPWPTLPNKQLLNQMDKQGPKLVSAVITGDPEEIIRRAVNLANYAMMIADKARAALAATEPATVDLPKCDHCDAIGCGTDCDGSSHYTPDGSHTQIDPKYARASLEHMLRDGCKENHDYARRELRRLNDQS